MPYSEAHSSVTILSGLFFFNFLNDKLSAVRPNLCLLSLSHYFVSIFTPYHLSLLSVRVLRCGLSRTLIFSRCKCKKIELNQLNLLSSFNHFSGNILMHKCMGGFQIKMDFKVELLYLKAMVSESTTEH